MSSKFISSACLVGTVVLVGISWGGTTSWLNTSEDQQWCNGDNWSSGVPTANHEAKIGGDRIDTIVIAPGCSATAHFVRWLAGAGDPNLTQTLTIESGGSLTIPAEADPNDTAGDKGNGFRITGSPETVVNVYGDFLGYGNRELGDMSMRFSDDGPTIANIFPGANVYATGAFRGADNTGGFFEVYMSGGDVNCGWFKLGDNGSGNFYMTGGTFATRRPGPESFTIRGRGGAVFEVVIDGGAELYVAGNLMTPQHEEAQARIFLNNGIISCDEWTAQGLMWVLDIDVGYLRIRDSDAATKAQVEQWIANDQIIGRGGTVAPTITWDGDDLVVAVEFIHETAWKPVPSDEAQNVCPDVVLSWKAGSYVADHNVYFGTSLADVGEGATPAVAHHGPNTWDPPGELALNTTYYWRVDTVNDVCAPGLWEGGIWEFTTTDGSAFAVYPLDGQTKVPIDVNLAWSACEADSYDVYFGTDFNDVGQRKGTALMGNQTETMFDPNGPNDLSYSTYYYWAIDKVSGGIRTPGGVWTFRTEGKILDPNMRLWYGLDEWAGYVAHDSSGYEFDGTVSGPEEWWEPVDGYMRGCRYFGNDSQITVPPLVNETLSSEITITCWLKDAFQSGSDNWAFGTARTIGPYVRAAVPSSDEMNVIWQAGNDTNDVLSWDMSAEGIDPAGLEGWHHWAFVKSETGGYMKIYFDSALADSNDVVDATLASLYNTPFRVGTHAYHGNFVGRIDEFKLFDKALTEEEVAADFRGGGKGQAWAPSPFNGAKEVLRETILSWRAGDFATHHDVYFGTSLAEVRDGDTTSSVYQGHQLVGDTDYEPSGTLDLETTYYWRIDEVNDVDPNFWKGNLWSFTTSNYLLIDDFESYDYDLDDLYWFYGGNWLDGIDNGTGSTLYLGISGDPTHTGNQSLLYLYQSKFPPYYSEAERVINAGERDWTDEGVKMLTLFFYGDPGNDAGSTEQMYCGIEDGSSTYAEAQYGDQAGEDMSDIQVAEWHEWNIALSDFTNVGLGDVRSLFIGFGERGGSSSGGSGTTYFDDIRLYLPKCVPAHGPAYDFSGDCIVDITDVGMMADMWLAADAYLSISAPSEVPVGWWKLDGDANDSSTYANDGTAEGSLRWVAGHIDTGAIEFTGDGGRVLVPDAPQLNPGTAVTAAAWVNYSQVPSYSARIVVKGADTGNRETFALQLAGKTIGWFVRDANRALHGVGGDKQIIRGEWAHAAGTYDGEMLRFYTNGRLEGEEITGSFSLLVDANGVGIGNTTDAFDRALIGAIDDVRIYDAALSDENIAYIATQGTGYVPLQTPVNIHDGEAEGSKAVNFRDFAELMTAWLEQKLWPQ